jgi:hypothetical protein
VKHGLVVLAAAAMWSSAAPAAAQVIRTRPSPGIFGTGDPSKSRTQIDFMSFLGAGYETTTLAVDEGRLGSADTESGFGNLVFRGRFAHQGQKTTFGADAGATTSYYSGGDGLSPFNLSGGAHVNGALGRRGTFALRQSFYYSPFYVLDAVVSDPLDSALTAPEPGVGESSVDPRVDLRSARLSTKGYSSLASAGRQIGERGSLFVSYGMNYTDSAPGVYDVLSHAPRAGYRLKLGRWSSLVASYGLRLTEYRASPFDRLASHDVGLGLAYDRPLSAWRRTTVGFNVGTAFVRSGTALSANVTGNAHLNRRFGRTWITGVNYLRGQQVLEGFAAPFFTFSDTIAASASGRLFRELGLSGRASYSHNRFTLGGLTNEFDTVSMSTRLHVPIMWALAAYVEGYYSEHDFQSRLGLVEFIPTSMNRFGTRAGLTVSVPVLR